MKNWVYPEFVLALWAARRIDRPVKWIADRSESFLGDFQARDLVTEGELALDAEGRFLALRISNIGNVGGHTVAFVPLANGSRIVTSIYDIPQAAVRVRGVLTHSAPTAPYRGAGRPEAMHNLERLIDEAARVTGIDRVELRRRNLIPPEKLPYRNPLGVTYDCGAFHDNMEQVLQLSDWAGFEARRAEAKARGRLRGIGLSNYLETPVGWPQERAEITVRPEGRVDVVLGTQGHGQGHETTFAQVMVQQLGVPFEAVGLITGDTEIVKEGGGSHSDRSMRLAGSLMFWGCADIIKKGNTIAGHLLEAAESDIEFAEARFVVRGTDRSVGLFEVAAAAASDRVPEELRGRLGSDQEIWRRVPAYPTGAAVCELEIDPETGKTEIVRWSCVDDVGRVINPMIVHGQVHGGIAQGIGQVLMEHSYYDAEGQLIAGSMMDYAMPRASDLPRFNVKTSEAALTASNPLGIKGGGEAGTTPALAAGMNAIIDALRPVGIRELAMPATPGRVWKAIVVARAGQTSEP
jgi:carbon-monoxide dehydrogenase large subunit